SSNGPGRIPATASLTLRELEPGARALLAVLLALLDARIAGQEAGRLEPRLQTGIEHHECPRQAVTDGAGLTGLAAAVDIHQHVELVVHLEELQRLTGDPLQGVEVEVGGDVAAVDH